MLTSFVMSIELYQGEQYEIHRLTMEITLRGFINFDYASICCFHYFKSDCILVTFVAVLTQIYTNTNSYMESRRR